jgi:oligopeptide transport system substrate-binding protein
MFSKTKNLVTVFALSSSLLLGLLTVFSLIDGPPNVQAASSPPTVITVSVNIGTEPPTLDPGQATDTTSNQVIEQLFLGLVDIDDTTGVIKPELASNWQISSDRTVFTFTLRNDVKWTDGNPVIAQDVQYAVFHALDPAENSSAAYLLFPIKNAENFYDGSITDFSQVGVTVIDATTIQFTLSGPLNYFSFFAQTPLRPVPQWAIDAWGSSWTEPANIVTSGAYQLSEWSHNNYIILTKNPDYFDAANVQIDRVMMWMEADDAVAGQMYLDGQLDTTRVWNGIPADVLNSHAVKYYENGCTYHYSYSLSQAPLDNLMVRKAFAAAINRQGLIDTVLGGQPSPALTFTPPGVFGHVDGYTEGIGIPHNPAQARQWLADAGYPNGQGLPPITLHINEGQEAIAEYIQNNWYTALGVSVTIQSRPWADHLAGVDTGQFQIWRSGWCLDYPDAYNFLHDGIWTNRGGYGSWSNSTYDALLAQALQTQDEATKKQLYKQAEEILVESDAAMIPLYYYVSSVVSKPYLARTYPVLGNYDISEWYFTHVYKTVDDSGGSVTSMDNKTTIQFPSNAFSDTVNITFSPAYATGLESGFTDVGQAFEITAAYSSTGSAVTNTAVSFTITISYNLEAGIAAQDVTNEDNIGLYYWDGSQWLYESSSTVNTNSKTITAVTDKLGLWAILEKSSLVYLPLILK